MRYAILSDVHGRRQRLEAVLADAQHRGVDQVVSLGDVGGDECVDLLRRADAQAVFGNYEVSGWRRLNAANRAWVRRWPMLLIADGFLAAHAVPWAPEDLQSVAEAGAWLRQTGRSWRALFPYLNDDQKHRWQALAELEAWRKPILFHGHTHQQTVWRWSPPGTMAREPAGAFPVRAGTSYLVGVGSVGLPEGGGWAEYTLYDTDQRHIEQVQLDSPSSRRVSCAGPQT